MSSPSGRPVPLVVAHRGSSELLPEHTLEAYLHAMRHGADALECDVRLTADGHLVCVHDRHINRTSDGYGRVSTLELATLAGLDWGSWKRTHGYEVELPDRDRGRLLTLRRLLTTVRETDPAVSVAIETKHPTRYAGQVERQLAKLLAEFDLHRAPPDGSVPVRLMSFSALALQRLRQLCPGVPLVYLMESSVPLRFRDGSLPRGVRIAGLDKEILLRFPQIVQRMHRAGHQAFVWTVDEPEDVSLCLELGVDAIITNRPGDVRDRLGRTG